jgi:D-alanyl-D-alanine carboxypeptidase
MNESEDKDSIVFVVLNIQKDPALDKSAIKLVNKTQTPGTIKKQNQELQSSKNYLSISVYNKKDLLDSIIIDHPLYKHIEYVNSEHVFETKDTILNQSEFFIRFHSKVNSIELRFIETINNLTSKDQTIIKLY